MATVPALKNCFHLMGIEFLLPALWVSHSMTILAAKFTHRQWETTEWDWFYSRMILTEGNRSTGRETCHSTNISTTNSRWTLAFAMTALNLQTTAQPTTVLPPQIDSTQSQINPIKTPRSTLPFLYLSTFCPFQIPHRKFCTHFPIPSTVSHKSPISSSFMFESIQFHG